jgi:hypothetical protein
LHKVGVRISIWTAVDEGSFARQDVLPYALGATERVCNRGRYTGSRTGFVATFDVGPAVEVVAGGGDDACE